MLQPHHPTVKWQGAVRTYFGGLERVIKNEYHYSHGNCILMSHQVPGGSEQNWYRLFTRPYLPDR